MPQVEQVKYISASAGKQKKEAWEERLSQIINEATKERRENAGFIKLRDMKRRIYYYHHDLRAIFGDLSQWSVLIQKKRSYLEQYLTIMNQSATDLKIGNLPAGVLSNREYQLFRGREYAAVAQRLGWIDLTQVPFMTVEPLTVYGEGNEVSILPIFRCKMSWNIGEGLSFEKMIVRLISRGFLPEVGSEVSSLASGEAEDRKFMENVREYDTVGSAGDRENVSLKIPNEEELEKIRKYFCEKPHRRADLPSYDYSIFQASKGSWDLYPFAGLKKEELTSQNAPWYQVEGFFARDPHEDVAPDSTLVAIDFGTRSTTVAIFDGRGGNITVIPIGKSADAQETFENPTILKFCDIQKFMEAYGKEKFQPDTEFKDLMVSYQALDDFERVETNHKKNMLQYLNQLKQWANSPQKALVIQDERDIVLNLDASSLKDGGDSLNPIEVYAYYIGLNINNMHQGKIYLKYLLSYSATYLEESCQYIRSAFEKGIKKSLPPEIGQDDELMKRFEVRLWQDEATAYAVCALSQYLTQDYIRAGKGSGTGELWEELEKGDIFYGIYDFGGGTLDFSFGIMEQAEQAVYHKLGYGGGSHLGCENILEELAFRIFYDDANRERLIKMSVRCNKPMFYGMREDEGRLVGTSNAARFNSCNLISVLRRYWMDRNESSDLMSDSENPYADMLQLQGENGEFYETKLGGRENDGWDEIETVFILRAEPEEIEKFFREKVAEGVKLFVDFYRDIIQGDERLQKKKIFVFLAGNASRAKRVRECFEKYLREQGLADRFCINDPLPTDWDREQKKKDAGKSIPTAKSGVVYGLLMARPGAELITVTDEMPRLHFHYYIGQKKINYMDLAKGDFQLLARPDQIPRPNMPFRNLRKVTKARFELLYTDDKSYGLGSASRPITDSVHIATIHVPDEYVGCWLYGRACSDISDAVVLGVSRKNEEFKSQLDEIIGTYCFADDSFCPAEPRNADGKKEQQEEKIEEAKSFQDEESVWQQEAAVTDEDDPGYFLDDPEVDVYDSQKQWLCSFRLSEIPRQTDRIEIGSTSADAVEFITKKWGREIKRFRLKLSDSKEKNELLLFWYEKGNYLALVVDEGEKTYKVDFEEGTCEEIR